MMIMDEMSDQKYKRTNFDEDEITSNGGTPPGVTYDASVSFKLGATWWQLRTLLEKILLVLVLIFIVVVVILAAVLATTKTTLSPKKGEPTVCISPSCVTVASSVINSMDLAVDPCTDFYNYACGGWIKYHPIPQGHSRWGTFRVLWRENQLVMKNVIEQPLNNTATLAEQKAQWYYQSCLDVNKSREDLGAQPMLELISTLGGWSVSNSSGYFDLEKFDFQKAIESLHSYDPNTLFLFWVGEDEKNSSTNVLHLDQTGLALSRDYYLNKTIKEDKVLSAYLKFMTDIGVLLGGQVNDTEDQMLEVIMFEQRLANITVPAEERRDEEKNYRKKPIKWLQKISPFVNWKSYVNSLLQKTGVQVNDNEPIVMYAHEYMTQVSNMVEEMLANASTKRTLHTYLMWHLVKPLTSCLSQPFKDAHKAFRKALQGSSGTDEEWRECVMDTDAVLGFALGAMFVREAFHGNSRQKAEAMISEVKAAFKRNLPNLDWMDPQTRKSAEDKANAVVDMIGFPDFILEPKKLDDYYKNLVIDPEEYFLNNVRNIQFDLIRNLGKLRKPPNKRSWSMTPPTVNAYYTPTKNEIVFPAGILQAPFYDRNYPKSLNFGGMGVVMGHELTHGFDDQGREYDKTGNLRPWWNNASIARFKKRTECMSKQYSRYTVNGEHVRGKQTLGENIADNGGLKSAYHAYLDWVRHHGEEQLLPGTNLTHRQLFFVAFAQVWCEASTKEESHLQLMTDPHSPGKFRVIGALSNSHEFAEQFECRANSSMNPIKKCEVW